VVGAYRWLPEIDAALLVEQPQETALAREDHLAAMFVGSALAVALLTTMLAAVITRQLTRPIVQLTVSAVRIANGDLGQSVDVGRRDEIGILAQAFNIMTSELRSLYSGLERKVADRTRRLVEANRQLRYQAMQLTLSAEIGRVATSILDLDLLLDRVTELILDSYARVYSVHYVAVLLQDSFEEGMELQASAGVPGRREARGAVGECDPVGQTVADGHLRTMALGSEAIEVTVPLRIGARVIGVLDLYCSERDALAAPDLDVLQSLGDQISVAIENARIYAAEREALARLSRLDDLRVASLGAGSRELATELNTIIGFSRLMLKGADGPLTELQRSDLVAIHKSGYSLLGLIDNVITLSELESGALRPDRSPVDLGVLLNEVGAIAKQRLVSTTTEMDGAEDLPPICGDEYLLRLAFLELVTAAAERMSQSEVSMRAVQCDGDPLRVVVHIGKGDRSRRESPVCEPSGVVGDDPGCPEECDDEMEELSIALMLARQIIQLHGGRIHLRFAERGLDCLAVLPADRSQRAGITAKLCQTGRVDVAN
jgi:signal transduction histidine kinase